MLRRAQKRAATAGRPIEAARASRARRCPYPDDAFDTVVASLVLCSVNDQDPSGPAEIRRVLRPGGRYLFTEHVRLPTIAALARKQDRYEGLWKAVCFGCHPQPRHACRASRRPSTSRTSSAATCPTGAPKIVRPFILGRALEPA